MVNWLTLTLISTILFTTMNLLQRVLAVSSHDQRAAAIVFNFTAASMAFAIFILTGAYQNFSLPSSQIAYIGLVVGVVSYGLFERLRFVAAKRIDASTLTIITTLGIVIAFIGSAIIYHEDISISKMIGSLLILSAIFIVPSPKNQHSKKTRSGLLIGLAISLCIGFALMMDKNGALFFSSETYSILVWSLPLLIVIYPGIKVEKLYAEIKIGSWRIILMALVNVLAYATFLKAFTLADATKVMPIGQLSTIMTVLLGAAFLNERDGLVAKIIAGLIATVGAILLV